MTYERFPSVSFISLEEADLLDAQFEFPSSVKGMNALDYEPDLDDYEYIQSLYC